MLVRARETLYRGATPAIGRRSKTCPQGRVTNLDDIGLDGRAPKGRPVSCVVRESHALAQCAGGPSCRDKQARSKKRVLGDVRAHFDA